MKGNEMRPPGMASQGQDLERRVDGNHSQRALTVGIAFLGEIARSVAGLANCECAAAAGTATLGQGSKGAAAATHAPCVDHWLDRQNNAPHCESIHWSFHKEKHNPVVEQNNDLLSPF
jgi:hypothetical protein